MFGLGFGEIFIILLLVFFLAPKDIPKIARKIGEILRMFNRFKRDLIDIEEDIAEQSDIEQMQNDSKKKDATP